jgi:hypothetical protein
LVEVSIRELVARAIAAGALKQGSEGAEGAATWLAELIWRDFYFMILDLERKIRLYRDYWTKHWESLRGCEYLDLAEQNMMFDVPWSQVTNSMIQARAIELNQIGGWIWHRKWDGTKTPWITCNRTEPKLMIESHAERKTHCTDTIIKSQ